jgi:hypothetical protein
MEDALERLDEDRDELMAARPGGRDLVAQIPDEAEPLRSYLDPIKKEVGVEIRNSVERPTVPKGKFRENAQQITLTDVGLREIMEFLRRVETKAPTVVTQTVKLKRSNGNKERFDRVELVIASYERGGKSRGAPATEAEPPAEAGAGVAP